MKRRWVRLEPGRRENAAAGLAAAGVGAVVGAVVFYLARVLLSRERVDAQDGAAPRLPPNRGKLEGGGRGRRRLPGPG